jgi:hypothetical protein
LAGSTRDVGPADLCGSVAVMLSKCGFRGASRLTKLKASSVPGDGSSLKTTTESSTGGDVIIMCQ